GAGRDLGDCRIAAGRSEKSPSPRPSPGQGRGRSGEAGRGPAFARKLRHGRRRALPKWRLQPSGAADDLVLGGGGGHVGTLRAVVGFLTGTGFGEGDASAVIGFSIREVLFYILFLALSGAMVWLIMNGRFAGPRTRWAGILLGSLLVIDMARANMPWIKYYDY